MEHSIPLITTLAAGTGGKRHEKSTRSAEVPGAPDLVGDTWIEHVTPAV
jgi:hypothetical protein